ncbi:MAG: amidohydrolase family protein [Verrucomicrobiales bacterium]|nr:amidohydrolase family protein [Verrucomicrobiales bacterium]
MKRRNFLKTTTSFAATATAAVPQFTNAAKSDVEIIDIHQHVNFHGRTNEVLVKHQDTMGVSKTVLLPSGGQFNLSSTNNGRANGLAARVFGTEAAIRLTKLHPGKFVYFCNQVPDLDSTKADLEKWLKSGAKGIGEQKFKLELDSKPMQLIYEIAAEFEVPVLLHFQHKSYNMGFDRLPSMLKNYPKTTFVGHAQTMWGNIDANHKQEVMYPKTKVKPGGLTDRYLADYENFYGDLSAGSGQNSLTRDEEHAAGFLERHQDKLCLGTDCADKTGEGKGCSGAGTISIVKRLLEGNDAATAKIMHGNARRIIDFD